MKSHEIEVDFEKLINIFNNGGKKAAEEHIKSTYGVTYNLIQRRIRKETSYRYNRSKRRYEKQNLEDTPFLTMEELCKEKPVEKAIEREVPKTRHENKESTGFEKIVLSMMKDHLLELDKYIYLEQSSKRVMIDTRKLELNGYEVMIN